MVEMARKQFQRMNFVFAILLLSNTMIKALDPIPVACPCKESELCNLKLYENHREVTVITQRKSDFTRWSWEGIHNVINAAEEDNPDLMCYAHSKKANYGILVKMPDNEDLSSAAFDSWMNDSINKANRNYAEVIAVDLLALTGNCHKDEKHGQRVVDLTNGFAKRVRLRNHKLHCILPWKPPCFQTNCNVTASLKDGICDGIITSPESYITECDTHCRARATMPVSNMIIGADEYIYKEQVPASMFYAGIPWHGYDYKCHTLGVNIPKGEIGADVCYVPTKNGSNICDFESSRTKMTFYDLDTKYHDEYTKKHKWNSLYNSNYFNVKNSDGAHQIWYDSDETLYEKYKFALDMGFRGVVIWTVDDLMNYDKGDAQEWNWLLHTMMLKGKLDTGVDMSLPLKAAMIGVGCFIGGTIVGAIITTLISRRQMKLMNRRYQPPFQKDEDDYDTQNFHEDDSNL